MKTIRMPFAVWAVALGLAGLAQSAQALSGKLAYACSGKICIRDLASGATITGPSGVNPKFNLAGTEIVYQNGGVWVANADGSGARSVTAGGVPSFAPDGLQIAFHNGTTGIWKINADGTGLTQLTTHGRQAAWSPDGSQIAFSSSDGGTDSDLWVVNADGTNPHKILTRAGADIDVVWLRSSKILFAGAVAEGQSGYEVFSFDPATGAATRLTTRNKNDFEPGWSPDGSQVSFAALGNPAGIYVINADGSAPQLVVPGGRQGSWAP